MVNILFSDIAFGVTIGIVLGFSPADDLSPLCGQIAKPNADKLLFYNEFG